MTSDLKKRLALLAAIVAALLLVYLLWPSEAKKVERTVRGASAAFAAEDIFGLAGYLARDYADAQGLGYQEVLGTAKGLFDRYDAIAIHFVKLSVTLEGSRARVAATVHVTGKDKQGGDMQGFLGDRDTVELLIGLNKGTDGWRIGSVDRTGE